MEERKKRIEAFIASHKESIVESGALILGGKGQTPDSTMTAENGGNCSNSNFDQCDKSTNGGDCVNAQFMCNNSKNRGSCITKIKEVDSNQTTCGPN